MNTKPNKHGFPGVRKRTSREHHLNPYYARLSVGCDRYTYSKNFKTAEEAAAAYQAMKQTRAPEQDK